MMKSNWSVNFKTKKIYANQTLVKYIHFEYIKYSLKN